jgi:hypothetical protein
LPPFVSTRPEWRIRGIKENPHLFNLRPTLMLRPFYPRRKKCYWAIVWVYANAGLNIPPLPRDKNHSACKTLFCLTTRISLLSEFSRLTTCSSAPTDIPCYSVSESQISVASSTHVVHCTSDFNVVRNETKYLCVAGWQTRSRISTVSSKVSALLSRHKFYGTIQGEFLGLRRDSFLQFNVKI